MDVSVMLAFWQIDFRKLNISPGILINFPRTRTMNCLSAKIVSDEEKQSFITWTIGPFVARTRDLVHTFLFPRISFLLLRISHTSVTIF
jgi:hypothetical protein